MLDRIITYLIKSLFKYLSILGVLYISSFLLEAKYAISSSDYYGVNLFLKYLYFNKFSLVNQFIQSLFILQNMSFRP